MKNYPILICIFFSTNLFAQSTCSGILKTANQAYVSKKYELAFKKLQDVETCDRKNSLLTKRQTLQNKIFQAIQDQRELAEQQEKEARLAENEANLATQTIQANLKKTKESNEQIFQWLYKESIEHISKFEYEDALDKTLTAVKLPDAKKELVYPYFLEIAFWYNESGSTQQAFEILDTLTTVMKQKNVLKTHEASTSRQELQEVLKALDSAHYQLLVAEYYPTMVSIEGGTFQMGCDSVKLKKILGENESCPEGEDLKQATVETYRIAKTETTWKQYRLYCNATGHSYKPPSWGIQGSKPVVNVNWFDALFYLNWRSRQEGLDSVYVIENRREGRNDHIYDVQMVDNANGYRLPTEEQWEYAASGGDTLNYLFSGSDSLGQVAWFKLNFRDETHSKGTHEVGKKDANGFGLYDMSGNVSEWCTDFFDKTKLNQWEQLKKNHPEKIIIRIKKGGSWWAIEKKCRSAYFAKKFADGRYGDIGFRAAQ